MQPNERLARAAPFVVALVVVSAVIGVASYVDVFARHGYQVSWYADRHGERFETGRTFESRVVFPTAHRPMSRLIENWRFDALGVPAVLPPIDATFRTVLEVPSARFLHVSATGVTAIRVDGAPTPEDVRISSGFHRVEIDWSAPLERDVSFLLEWGPTPLAHEPVPARAMWPLHGVVPPMRVLLWVLALVLAAAGGLAAFLIMTRHGAARRRLVHLVTAILLVGLCVGYRAIDYDVMPDWRDNADEQLASWNGYSLLETGRPRSWTLWPEQYGSLASMEVTPYFGRTYHVMTPYFEHPPLTHLLVGAAAHLGGARSYREVRLSHVRLVPILLAGLNVLLILAIGRRLERRRIEAGGVGPYIGALLYAVLPFIVIQTRVVKEEVLLTTMILGCVWFYMRFRETQSRRALAAASVLAGLAILTKVPGFACVIALSILVLRTGGWRALVFSLSISLPLSALWPLYGVVYDARLFFFTQEIQSSRPVTFEIFPRFFDVGLINNNLVGRGWMLFLWLATMSTLHRRRAEDALVIAAPLFAYLAAIALGSGTWTYGWYVTPMLPWLTLGAGLALGDLWREPDLGRGALFVFLLVFYTLNFVTGAEVARPIVTGVLVAAFAPFALAAALPTPLTRNLARATLLAGLLVVVVVSASFVARYEVLELAYHDFDIDPRWGR